MAENSSNSYNPIEERAVYFYDMLAILGWSKAKYYKFNPETGMRWCDELKRAGVVMRQYEKEPGKRARLRLKILPTRLTNWMGLKAAKGQRI